MQYLKIIRIFRKTPPIVVNVMIALDLLLSNYKKRTLIIL